MPELHLHIGYPKTGTTSLQSTLEKSRKSLAGHGILFPATIDNRHRVLQAIGSPVQNKKIDQKLQVSSDSERADAIRKWLDGLAEEATSYHTVILSEETVATRPLEEIAAIRDSLVPRFDEVHVHVGFREHISFALSNYMQRVRATFYHVPFRQYANSMADKPFMSYSTVLAALREQFGAARVHPLIYDSQNNSAYNETLMKAMGVEGGTIELVEEEFRNKTPDIGLLRLKQALNRQFDRVIREFGGQPGSAVHDTMVDALANIAIAAKLPLATRDDLLDLIPQPTKRAWARDWAKLQEAVRVPA
ncbi:hypothetical protein E3C22_12835 [Jiella endophytica]|uniref:Sulfotransferase family protein n=1 Tax=Jiella endophytica TaxID=2558362 RepID=A0A4Y8RJY8_9HYPH|nr:hypothetical protein [Jiella endophytica]TFF23304.1 hypothetical protein E3C22_12835 [Jiella endophytica]